MVLRRSISVVPRISVLALSSKSLRRSKSLDLGHPSYVSIRGKPARHRPCHRGYAAGSLACHCPVVHLKALDDWLSHRYSIPVDFSGMGLYRRRQAQEAIWPPNWRFITSRVGGPHSSRLDHRVSCLHRYPPNRGQSDRAGCTVGDPRRAS